MPTVSISELHIIDSFITNNQAFTDIFGDWVFNGTIPAGGPSLVMAIPVTANSSLNPTVFGDTVDPIQLNALADIELTASSIAAVVPANAVISSIFATWSFAYTSSQSAAGTPVSFAQCDFGIGGSNNGADTLLFTHEYVTSPPTSRAFLLTAAVRQSFVQFKFAVGFGNLHALKSYGVSCSITLTYDVTYTVPAPAQLSASPSAGTVSGGTFVTIGGTDFADGATVTFDGIPALSVQFNGSGELVAEAPPHAAGTVDLVVTNPDSQVCTLPLSYTYTNVSGGIKVDQLPLEVLIYYVPNGHPGPNWDPPPGGPDIGIDPGDPPPATGCLDSITPYE